MTDGSGQARQTKVERVIDAYDLRGLEAVLVERWTGDGDERWSLRDLADFVNHRLLESALRQAGEQPLEGEVENHYRLLTDDDVSAGARTEAVSELERAGVDLDQIRQDFVSHQAVHTYLTDRQGVSYELADEEERVEQAVETISRLEGRTATVASDTIARLRDADVLDIGEFSVVTAVGFVCEECGTRHDLDTLLEEGGCDCR